jgi:hypothetical protein
MEVRLLDHPSPGRCLVLISNIIGLVDPSAIVWLEGLGQLGQLKNPTISLGIKLMTFWLVAYYLDQLRYCVPLSCTWERSMHGRPLMAAEYKQICLSSANSNKSDI